MNSKAGQLTLPLLGGFLIRITYGGVVVVMRLYLLGQCPELNFGHRLKLLILLRFKSFRPALACSIPGLKVLGKRRNPILLEVCMLVMLLNVKIHVLV
jgi:hypothetical protein